jgi:multimeric flavodoxin WrbA
MKIVGILGSGRNGGNTEILLREALSAAQEGGADQTELIKLSTMTIHPCDGCNKCIDTDNCRINDDMQIVYSKLLDADGIIIGSPVYFWNISGQTKIFIERTYPFIHKRRLSSKIGGIIVVSTRAGCSSAFMAINSFFIIQRMRVAGGAICYGEKKGEVLSDRRGIGEVKALGKFMTTLIKK